MTLEELIQALRNSHKPGFTYSVEHNITTKQITITLHKKDIN